MKIATALTTLTLISAGIVGCSSNSNSVSYSAITGNLSPELQGMAERPIDVDRHMAVTNNQNLRMMSDDWGRVFYTDHPSRLSPFPVAFSSGIPR